MNEEVRTAVIAAAGEATRMWPASKVFPKELFPLGRIPAIVHIVWEVMEAGIDNIVIVAARHNSRVIAELFDSSITAPAKVIADPIVKRFQHGLGQCSISIVEQKGAYGNATPLRVASQHVGNHPCVYAFGDDVIIGENATHGLVGMYQRTGYPVMGAQEVSPDRTSSFGILEYDDRDGIEFITRVVEKPRLGDTASRLASFGRYIVTPTVMEIVEQLQRGRDGEVWFTDAMITYLRTGGRACVFRLTRGAWYTVGDPRAYAEAVRAAVVEQSGPA